MNIGLICKNLYLIHLSSLLTALLEYTKFYLIVGKLTDSQVLATPALHTDKETILSC